MPLEPFRFSEKLNEPTSDKFQICTNRLALFRRPVVSTLNGHYMGISRITLLSASCNRCG